MRILFVSTLDYEHPSAAANRHVGLALSLAELGHAVSFLLPASGNLEALRSRDPTIGWFGTGRDGSSSALAGPRAGRFLGYGQVQDPVHPAAGPQVVFCLSRDPLVLEHSHRLARRSNAKLLHEITEFPDVAVAPGAYGRLTVEGFSRRYLRKLDGVVVISTALLDFVDSRTPSSLPKLLLPIMVDMSRFGDLAERPSEPGSVRTRIGYAGSLDPAKDGPDLLIQALAHAVELGGAAKDLELVMWGDGPQRPMLESLAKDLQMADRVWFAGRVTSAQVPDCLASADVLALARPVSRQAQGGFATKLAEYLASGRPVVTTTTSDIGRYLADGVSAYLVPPNDVAMFGDALARVAEDPASAAKVGAVGRSVAAENFSSTVAAQRFSDFIQGL